MSGNFSRASITRTSGPGLARLRSVVAWCFGPLDCGVSPGRPLKEPQRLTEDMDLFRGTHHTPSFHLAVLVHRGQVLELQLVVAEQFGVQLLNPLTVDREGGRLTDP